MVTTQQVKCRIELITGWGPVGAQQGGEGGGQEEMFLNFAYRDEIHQVKGLGVGRWKGGDGGGSPEAIPGRGTPL